MNCRTEIGTGMGRCWRLLEEVVEVLKHQRRWWGVHVNQHSTTGAVSDVFACGGNQCKRLFLELDCSPTAE